ncbi:PIR protein [Plasmodium yoelii]|uniref:PIR protein n=2 Tax=Plasmodium yoelii TaxID=5861 RepID=A0AAE9WJ97_PLAYO|nr:PIR protein [Plasmodium yoelii]WBY54922.1 PIR protein [Plasmodium yoelii yoelii]CDU16198.1 YIR protein [Plasmodium yoelii]VTZ72354.1 PIR protein [Plasmodium yoelii]|eukprot:XP_022811420.1 PIR protein [Plasmodium yoelii]
MMPHNLQCETFSKADKHFSDISPDFSKLNFTNELPMLYSLYDQIESTDKYNAYSEEIDTLGIWLIQKLLVIYKETLIYENYRNCYDYIMMHLSNKTHLMKNDENFHLNTSYQKQLDAFSLKLNYLFFLDYNNKYIRQFYILFDKVCNIINEYTENGYSNKDVVGSSLKCMNMYRIFYNTLNKCNSHFYLLENLKKYYNEFIISSINDNINEKRNFNLDTKLKKITNCNENNSYFKKPTEELGHQCSRYQNSNPYSEKENSVNILDDSKFVLKYLNTSDHKKEIGTNEFYKTYIESFNSQKNHGIESGNQSEISSCELKNTKENKICELVCRMEELLNPGIGLKRNGFPSIYCTNIYNENRINNIAIISIAIVTVLSIVYKYLSFDCPEKLKKKKR